MFGAFLIIDQNFLMLLNAIPHLNLLASSRSQRRPPLIQTLLQFLEFIRFDRQNLKLAMVKSEKYMFSILGLLSDFLGVLGGPFHILFQLCQFLYQSLQLLLTRFHDLGKLLAVLLVLCTGNIAGSDAVVEGGELLSQVVDFGFLTSEFDSTDFHDFFLEGFDLIFYSCGLSTKFVHVRCKFGDLRFQGRDLFLVGGGIYSLRSKIKLGWFQRHT